MIKQQTIIVVLFITLCYTIDVAAQLRYTTVANSSTTTTYGSDYQLATSGSNVFITFKRGTGSTTADREIKVARSNNNGLSFTETDVTISNNTNTYSPIIASTATSVVALYRYDSTSIAKTCIARSTNSGTTFNIISNSHANLWYVVQYPSSFISDGTSKYFICDDDYIFGSLDDGVTFTQLNTPTGFNNAYEARLAATSTYLWVIYIKFAMDSISVYRSSNNGTSYQLISQYFADLPSYSLFACEAFSDQLYIAWVHEEVGTYSLRFRTITGTTVGPVQDIATSTSSSYYGLSVRKTANTVWVKASDKVYRSISSAPWSRGSRVSTEITGNPSLYTYFGINDTTLYLSLNRRSTGSLQEYVFANIKWVDFPVPRLPNDTLITISSSVRIDFSPYVVTSIYRAQLSRQIDFGALDLDTLVTQHFWSIPMGGRFPAGNVRYYYRLRGEDGSYLTNWSQTRSFRYGALITDAPVLQSPPNGSSFVYPNGVTFGWSTVTNANAGNIHIALNSSFSDTAIIFNSSLNPVTLTMGWNGTLYWRVRGIELWTGSVGPWSSTGHFNYSGVPTEVSTHPPYLPTRHQLYQNFPNPFNPATTIRYDISEQVFVNLSIFNILSQRIATLVEQTQSPGFYSVHLDRSGMPSGIYLCRMVAGSYSGTVKLIIVK